MSVWPVATTTHDNMAGAVYLDFTLILLRLDTFGKYIEEDPENMKI